ncbi:DNA repair protein RecO [Planctomicrobium sp. SH661]|uniref:DNA repair protein RecO n=1 Tax=Planctomicrobium sp. SH661 TaxID=3448124 RepID=UPI003F5C5F37
MSAEKSDALVIRQADFSESSRVVTLFTRDFGKISCLAKGAKRLRSAFEVSLDLLSQCRIVFLPKSSGSLDLLTESQLIKRFQPQAGSLSHLYAGYYIAELLNALTEEGDPHPELYAFSVETLARLEQIDSIFDPVCRFELSLLREIGQIPDFETCTICQSEISSDDSSRFWVTQSGLICSSCGTSEYQTAEFQPGVLSLLRQLAAEGGSPVQVNELNPRHKKEIRKLLTAAISHVLGKRPKTLPLLNF